MAVRERNGGAIVASFGPVDGFIRYGGSSRARADRVGAAFLNLAQAVYAPIILSYTNHP